MMSQSFVTYLLTNAYFPLFPTIKLNQTPMAAGNHEEMQSRLHILVAHALQLGDGGIREVAEEASCHQAELDAGQVATEAGCSESCVRIILVEIEAGPPY